MKTLILTGSPRKKGHTAELTEYLAARLDGEVEVLSLDHRTDIMPCRDCRYCFTHRACCIQDPMQEIYQKLDEADRILFAAACTDVVTMGGSDKAGLSDRPDIQHALETLAQKLKA